MGRPAPSARFQGAGRVFLAVCALVSAFFFASRWAINAPGLGAHDAGLALALSFANPLSVYACLALALAGAGLAAASALRGRPWRAFLAGALVAALPVAYLALRG